MTRLRTLTLLAALLLPASGLAQDRLAPRPHAAPPGGASQEAPQGPGATPWEDPYWPAPDAASAGVENVEGEAGERPLSELSVTLDAPVPDGSSSGGPPRAGDPVSGSRPQSDQSDAAGRVGGELLGGVVGLAAAGLVGVGMAAAVSSGCGAEDDFCGLGAAVVGGFGILAATTLAVPLGVTVAGDAGGGNGGLGWSVLGGAAGMMVGSIAAYTMVSANDDLVLPALLTFVASHFGGAILGYELSAGDGVGEEPGAARAPSLAPAVALTRDVDGLVLGVAGTM